MENELKQLILLAENVSISEESKLDPIFLKIDVKLCDTLLNRNREGCTERFIQDVVDRMEDHQGLPFYADVDTLLAGKYEELSHLYDKATRTFGTNMIGSMYDFRTETDENGVTSLYGTIRVPKRDRDIVFRLVDLYEMGRFAVSVEMSYDPREAILTKDGKFIDASENNSLTGLCLVWRPACETAYALDMVAEENAESSGEMEIVAESEELSERGENSSMEKEKEMMAEQEPETQETVAENIPAVAEDTPKEDPEQKNPEEDTEDPEDDKDEAVAETQEANAEVVEHSVDTHESVENWGGGPMHVIEYHERIIETMDEAATVIAELEQQVAELNEIKGKYDAMIAEAEAKALAEKQSKARAFAEKQGLDLKDTAVAEAIEKLDYEKIAEIAMAQVTEEEVPETKPEAAPVVALASFVDMEISNDQYGGLLSRRSK